jgi:hypothetical protein
MPKEIRRVLQGPVYETMPASTTLHIEYKDGTSEDKIIVGEDSYSPYRTFIKNPYPHDMGSVKELEKLELLKSQLVDISISDLPTLAEPSKKYTQKNNWPKRT